MEILHYTYLVLKIPTPNGVPSIYGDLIISCDNEAIDIAATNAYADTSAVVVVEDQSV
jgi:hypothetical protein